MPIELTRREMVRAGLSLSVGGAFAAVGCASQREAPGPLTDDRVDRVLVLSDTHIAANPSTLSRAGVNMADRLTEVIGRAYGPEERRWKRPADWRPMGSSMNPQWEGAADYEFTLIDGDAAYDIGRGGDYETLIERLLPIVNLRSAHVLLGNHDDRDNFRVVLNDPPSELTDKHVRKLGVADGSRYCDWVLLDSLRVVDEVPGELEAAQLAWLDETLAESSSGTRPAIIVVHHPPVPDDDPDRPFALQDYEAFWAVVARHRNVKAVLHGHTHCWQPRKWSLGDREVDLIGLPPTSYVFDEANPWGYVVADVDAAGVSFTLRAMDGHAADGKSVRVVF